MQKKYEIAGSVMGFFDSFKGSAPAIDNDKISIHILKFNIILRKILVFLQRVIFNDQNR